MFAPPPPSAAWQHREARSGFEVAHFQPHGEEWRVEGCTAAVEDGRAWVVRYAIVLDHTWATRQAQVWGHSSAGSGALVLTSDGAGHWEVDGHPAGHLDGCLDVDLESSAMTNAFPVHRLALAIGAQAQAPAAYVRAAGLAVERLEQTYTRLDDDGPGGRYAYRAPDLEFGCQLTYDGSGLVLAYPGIALRVPLAG